MDWAKIKGIMPAILTIKGRLLLHRHGHAVAHPASGEEHRHIAPALLDKHNRKDRQHQDDQDQQQHPPTIYLVGQERPQVAGHARNDTGKDDQRKPWLGIPYSEINCPNQIPNIVPAIIVTRVAIVGSRVRAGKADNSAGSDCPPMTS